MALVTHSTPVSEAVRQQFVGRADALNAFYLRFAYKHMKNGIYYCGDGGLGKTWILKKIIVDSQDDPSRVITEIIDFFDTQNYHIRGLQATIKDRLRAPDVFQAYDETTTRLDKERTRPDVHPSALASLEARANRLFIQACQEAIIGREVVLLFDTFERVQQRDVGQWLLQKFLPQVRSLIVAIAGRPEPGSAHTPDNFVLYELKGLNLEETDEYVHRYWEDAPDTIVESIWRSSDGAPLMIDLILSLPVSLREQYVDQLSRLDGRKKIQNSDELQRSLVGQFSIPNRRNRVIWAMAYLYRRFDVQMLRYIVAKLGKWFKPDDYDEIFDELCKSSPTYVKEYPDLQSHLLHDEVQRMVTKYLLDETFGEWNEMREDLFDLVVNHYYPETIKIAGTANTELAHQLQAERMGYIFDGKLQVGTKMYQDYLRKIEDTHIFDFEELLWGEVREHLKQFEDKGYQISFERGQWLHQHGLFQRAEGHYRQMVSRYENKRIESEQALGFMLMRQGNISEAEKVFTESRTLVKGDDFTTIAMIENNLGQVSRAAGKWDQALEHYAESFRAATMARDPAGIVSVHINRGYLYSLQGMYPDARQQCERAINFLKLLPNTPENIQRGIYARMNLGTAYRHDGDYESADKFYKECLELAKANKNREALCEVLQHCAINQHLWGRMLRREERDLVTACDHQLEAWRYLTQALEIARESDWSSAIADGLNRLAKIYREIYRLQNIQSQHAANSDFQESLRKLQQAATTFQMPFEIEYEHELLTTGHFTDLTWLKKAIRMFEVSALVAEEVNNFHRALESLIEVARTLVELGGLEDKVQLVIRRIERLGGYDYQEILFAAMNEIIRGDLEYKRQNYPSALDKYKKAYTEIAQQSGYATYIFKDRLRDLEWRLRRMPPELALKWCDTFEDEWKAQLLTLSQPAMLDLLERIRVEILS